MRKILLAVILLFFTGCVKETYNMSSNFPTKNTYKIIPFANLTQTPMAGYKVAGILEGVLRSKGVSLNGSLWNYEERDYSVEDINDLLKNVNARYIITGYVNEYRYKTGIDGEPAVSVTVKIYDKAKKQYIYVATFSRVGDTYNSVGVLTQEGFDNLFKLTK
ncbi:putative lipoprotein [Nautilia profundicola AmH]|uniref:Lipoprotein n=1 Tax=Nautilia profundicola (strain ATCC BAA-1463 / DSM 18972 / AmH) TaxID=598659 RepID=B9L637_NAUPA|nr:lipoprotein [Nautilia profundicola]ACM92985.1 putative lipoprotein [Nautilia profundicola AmH]